MDAGPSVDADEVDGAVEDEDEYAVFGCDDAVGLGGDAALPSPAGARPKPPARYRPMPVPNLGCMVGNVSVCVLQDGSAYIVCEAVLGETPAVSIAKG